MAVKLGANNSESRWRKLPHSGTAYENNNYLVREQVRPGRREGFKPWIYQNLPYLVVGLVAVLCYWNSLYGDLVHDDIFAIKGNQDVRGNTPWINLFRNDFWGKSMSDNTSHKSYRPLCVLTFRLNYMVHGLSPFGYHVTNVVLHTVTSLLLLYICCHLVFIDRIFPSCIAAILFAVHPIHTEAVASIVGRADILSCLLGFLSFLSYAMCICDNKGNKEQFSSTGSTGLLVLTIVTSSAAMLCKETGITVLGVCFCYEVLLISRAAFIRCFTRKNFHDFLVSDTLLRLILLIFTGVLLMSFRLWVMSWELPQFTDQDNPASFSPKLLTRVLTFSYLPAHNLWLLLFPSSLSYDWQMNSIPLVESVIDCRNAATVLLILLIAVISFQALSAKQETDRRVLCLSLVFFIIPFLPASNLLFRVGFVVAERILYIPSVGLCIMVAYGIENLSYKYRRKTKLLYCCFTVLLLLLSARTVLRNRVWSSRHNLFLSGLQTLPHNAKMHYNYANLMKDTGNNEKAIHHYRQTLSLWPGHASASNNLGTLLNNDTEAEKLYESALHLSSGRHAGAYFNLGNLYHHQGRTSEAITALESALHLDPVCPDVAANLAAMKENQGDLAGAERLLQELVYSQGDVDAFKRYAAFLYRTGSYEMSYDLYNKALLRNPRDHEALLEAAHVLRSLGDTTQAMELINRAVNLDRSAETLDTAGVFYFNTGNIEPAITLFSRAKTSDKANVKIKIHMAQALASSGKYEEGLKELHECLAIDPENIETILHITKIYGVTHQHTEALTLLQDALQIHTDNKTRGEVWFEIGNHQKDTKQYDEALAAFQQAVRLNPILAEAHLNIGVLYHMQNNYSLALHHYNVSEELDPENQVVKINKKKLNRVIREKEQKKT